MSGCNTHLENLVHEELDFAFGHILLAISYQLVDVHVHQLKAESEPPGGFVTEIAQWLADSQMHIKSDASPY